MKSAIGILLVAMALMGCAGFPASETKTPQAEWRVGRFAVAFFPGPRHSGQDRTFSYYSIKDLSQEDASAVVVESAYAEKPHRDPKDSIRVIGTASGDRILIEETVPNDCCPCTNYALVSTDAEGSIRHTFLKLPEKGIDTPRTTAEFGEYPAVISIDGGVVEYRYSDGLKERKKIGDIEKATRPEQPG